MTPPKQLTTPPVDTPIMFLAGEWGCDARWYAGYAHKPYTMSTDPVDQEKILFMVYPLFMGYPPGNPPFHAPEYRGVWREMTSWEQAFWPGDKKKYDEYWKKFLQNPLPMKV